MGQPIVHWEIAAKDAKPLSDFYGNLFEWKIEANAMPDGTEYNMVDTDSEAGIGGGIFQTTDEMPTYVTIYVQVDDLQAYLDKAEALGGKTIFPPTPGKGVGGITVFPPSLSPSVKYP